MGRFLVLMTIFFCSQSIFSVVIPEFKNESFFLDFRTQKTDGNSRLWIFLFKKDKEKPFLIWPTYDVWLSWMREEGRFQDQIEQQSSEDFENKELPGRSFTVEGLAELVERREIINLAFNAMLDNSEFVLGRKNCLHSAISFLIPDRYIFRNYDRLACDFSQLVRQLLIKGIEIDRLLPPPDISSDRWTLLSDPTIRRRPSKLRSGGAVLKLTTLQER